MSTTGGGMDMSVIVLILAINVVIISAALVFWKKK